MPMDENATEEEKVRNREEEEAIMQREKCCNCLKVGTCRCGEYLRPRCRAHCDCCCIEELEPCNGCKSTIEIDLVTKEASLGSKKKQCCGCTPKRPCCLRKCISCCTMIRDGSCCESRSSGKGDKEYYELETRGRVYVESVCFPL